MSRQEITFEYLEIFDRSNLANQSSEFYARLRFPDDSMLEIVEKLSTDSFLIRKSRYVYHYQTANEQLVFGYDNAPHHPEITTHPHHKHADNQIIASTPPDLSDVLREIDDFLYPQQRGNS